MTSKQSQKTSDLTVVIPTKNSEAYLTKCLESIKSCKEVIVVDSNSKDKTKSIVDAYGRTYIKFKWNKKYPKKRAWVLDNVKIKTQWVLMLDSDECVSEEWWKTVESHHPCPERWLARTWRNAPSGPAPSSCFAS